MGNQLPSKQLGDFIGFVKECQEVYQIAYSCVGDEDKRSQDFLHAIEFTDDKYDLHREALKLQESRRERRRNKDLVEEREDLVKFFQDPQHKRTLDQLTQLLGRVRKVEKYHTDRTYYPRVREE